MDKLDILEFLLRIPIVLLSLSVHEAAHGYVAYKLGDPTAHNLGRLSLNPLKHLDPIGALCMVFFRFGWAKPVPISTRYFKKPKRDMALSALAGPVSNLLLAFITYIISAYVAHFGTAGEHFMQWNGSVYFLSDYGKFFYVLYLFFSNFYWLNISLAVFNLLPVPPLDGSRILFVLLPDKLYFGIMKYEQYIYLALMACLVFGLLDGIITSVVWFFTIVFDAIVGFLPFL